MIIGIKTKESIPSSKKIIEASQKYFVGFKNQITQEWVPTFEELELETKINIEKLEDVETILCAIKAIGFSNIVCRTEWHHFFSDDLIAHNVLILVNDSNEIWVKIKSDKKIVYTSNGNFPLLLRHEKKVKPQDSGYRDKIQQTVTKKYIASFKKECLDFSFYYKGLSFTATLSLAETEQSRFYQIEFEFDGHKKSDSPPKFDEILDVFDQMLSDICKGKTDRINTRAKLDWLSSVSGN